MGLSVPGAKPLFHPDAILISTGIAFYYYLPAFFFVFKTNMAANQANIQDTRTELAELLKKKEELAVSNLTKL